MFDHDEGWVAVPDVLAPDEVAALLGECEQLLALPAEERLARDRPHSGTQHLDKLDDRIEAVRALVTDSVLTQLVADVLDGPFEVTQAHFRCPQPGYGGQDLHADGLTYGELGSTEFMTAIVALVDFTERNGATRVLPGSLHRPDLQRKAHSLGDHPDEIRMTGKAGTAFVFGGGVLHAGAKNSSAEPRPALQLIWRSEAGRSRAGRERSSPLDFMTTGHGQTPPIPEACTLSREAAEDQALEWVDLRTVATSAAAIPSGVRLTFRPSLFSAIEDLVERERTCCSFLSFDLAHGRDEVVLEVTGESSDAQRTINSFTRAIL